jgi:BASS family bile acid:Na+ symporter
LVVNPVIKRLSNRKISDNYQKKCFCFNIVIFFHKSKFTYKMTQQFLLGTVFPVILASLMFGMGLTLKLGDFKRVALYPKAALLGLINQIVLLPVLGLIVVTIIEGPIEISAGLMIIALCPGGATSNSITYFSRGDVALSITLTALSSVITVFTIPFFLNWALIYLTGSGQLIQLPVWNTVQQIITLTAIPVALGLAVGTWFPKFAAKAERPIGFGSVILIVLAVVVIIIIVLERGNLGDFILQAGPVVLLLNASSLTMGYLTSRLFRLPVAQAITISIETGIQNGLLGIVIASSPKLLNQPEMAIPAAVYGILMCLMGLAAVFVFRRMANSSGQRAA